MTSSKVNLLRFGVIGVGHLGAAHARILSQLKGAQLVGVADPDEQARRRVLDGLPTTAFADYRELIGRIDAAVVATPTRWHHCVGMELLSHGIHLLIEKPLACTVAEADDLIAAARRHGALLQVGHIEQFNPALEPVLAQAQEPKFIDAVRCGGFTGRSTDIGVVLDLMIHDLDLALSLVRSPVCEVDALGFSVFGGQEDVANARLRFENGCVANFSASRVSPVAIRRMNIWSQQGFCGIDFADRSSTVIRPGEKLSHGPLDVQSLSWEERQSLKDELFETYLSIEAFQPPPCDQLTVELKDFLLSIEGGHPPRVSGEQGRAAVHAAELILQQIALHAWDGRPEGRIGPHGLGRPDILAGPYRVHSPDTEPPQRKEAG